MVSVGAPGASAAYVSASDVSAAISAPSSGGATFPATGTITNTGYLTQSGNSTLTISASGGSVGGLPSGCVASAGAAVCTVANLASGAAKSWTVTVTPNVGATSVTTTAVAKSAQAELNVFPDNANNSASTATGVLFSVDASLSNNPTVVRFGDDTLLTASVANTAAPQNVTFSLATGGTYDPALPLPSGCSATGGGATVNCTASYAAGQTRSFDIAVITPASGTSITSTVNATGASGGSDSASVDTSLFSDATAFVPQSDHLASTAPHSTSDFFVKPGSAPGLFLDLNEVALASGTNCGATACGQFAVEALFPNSGTYSGSDPAHPFEWDISYGKLACNGGGAPKCTEVLYYIPSGATVAIKMPKCQSFGLPNATLTNVNQVCMQNAVKSLSGVWTFRVALLRDIIIPIIGGTSGAK